MGMARLYRTPIGGFRNRHVVASLLVCFTIVYLLGMRDTTQTPIQKFPRPGTSVEKSPPIVKSSFDWANIEFKYPPESIRPLPTGKRKSLPQIQHSFGAEPSEDAKIREKRRTAVRDLTKKNWESYRKYAWKKDALLPLSAGSRDQFSGWAATLVDSLDTLWIMGLTEEFEEALEVVAGIDFGKSTSPSVNIFETTIRHLGGLLAAYDLSKRGVLLQKAIELGDLVYAGFNTPNRMPVDMMNFNLAKQGAGLTVEHSVVSASPGTLSLEMTRLSQLTGDPKYYDAVAGITDLFYEGRNKTALPGMFPMYVSMSREDVVTGSVFTLAGCADSLYEYFPKMHILLGGLESKYAELTRGFMEAAKRYIFFRPMVLDDADILISGNINILSDGTPSLDPESEHLACFIGGTFAMAGRLLNSERDVEVGARLARGCAYAYHAFPTGMMPERFNMIPCDSNDPKAECKWDEDKWIQGRSLRPEWKAHLPKGFTTAKDPRYILRPEAIESVFYLWRITGRSEWQDYAWGMFQAVANGTAAEFGSAAVLDVTVAREPLPREDYMESFWIAETLKYFYLAFSPPDLISLDQYVFNTEAHPFRRT
ncbi:glycoside hydrolase family 47 protein [Coniochaeta sp. 2T2.1]|nr:glycoside hydrolase family 47 protein [Coniochaeta sp. 2T2.1]